MLVIISIIFYEHNSPSNNYGSSCCWKNETAVYDYCLFSSLNFKQNIEIGLFTTRCEHYKTDNEAYLVAQITDCYKLIDKGNVNGIKNDQASGDQEVTTTKLVQAGKYENH